MVQNGRFRLTFELGILLLAVLLPFLLVNFNQTLGIVFGFMVLFDLAIVDIIRRRRGELLFSVERDFNRVYDVGLAVGGTVVFTVFMAFVSLFLDRSATFTVAIQSVFQSWQATAPVLQTSALLAAIGWIVIIPWVESGYVFGRIQGLFIIVAKLRRDEVKLSTPLMWVIFIATSLTFAVFHLTVRAVAVREGGIIEFDTFGLIGHFTFGMISCMMVVYKKELFSAKIMHILFNGVSAISG